MITAHFVHEGSAGTARLESEGRWMQWRLNGAAYFSGMFVSKAGAIAYMRRLRPDVRFEKEAA